MVNAVAFLFVALVFPAGLYFYDASIFTLYAAPIALIVSALVSLRLRVNVQSIFLPLLLSWLLGILVTALDSALRSSGDFVFDFWITNVTFSGIAFGWFALQLLRLRLIHPKTIEYGLMACGFVFIFLVLVRTPIAEYSQLLSLRFGTTANMNPNHMAAIFDLALPLCAKNLITRLKGEGGSVAAWGLGFVLLIICSLLTSTRGSFPAVLMTLIYFYFKSGFGRKAKVAIVLLAVPLSLIFGQLMYSRIQMHSLSDLASSLGRVWLLEAAVSLLQQNMFIFGIGINSFALVKFHHGFPKWFDPGAVLSSHNLHLEIYLGLGLIAILGWIVFHAVLITRFAKLFHQSESIPVLIALLGFLMHSLVDSLFVQFDFIIVVWVFLGYCVFLSEDPRVPGERRGDLASS